MPTALPEFDPRGGRCQYCGEYMLEADGCNTAMYLLKDGRRVAPLPFGWAAEGVDVDAGSRCHDCGAKPGHVHHSGCDVERCPVCFMQAISCDKHMDGAQMLIRKSKQPAGQKGNPK